MKKLTLKEKKELYTVIWKEAKRLYKKYDLCQIKNNTCLRFTSGEEDYSFCCKGCTHLSSKGCMVQSLSCAVHCCYFGHTHFPFGADTMAYKIQNRITTLKKIAVKNEIPFHYRKSKEENFYMLQLNAKKKNNQTKVGEIDGQIDQQ